MNTDLTASGQAFLKMHGLGNDFAVFDGRGGGYQPSRNAAVAIADRRFGIGCDQVITIVSSDDATARMIIQNADGSEAGACGNATRCVAMLLMQETGRKGVTIETSAGILKCFDAAARGITVNMGVPSFASTDIPLSQDCDTMAMPITVGPLSAPVAVSVGNPHAVFFVGDVEQIRLETLGPEIEHNPLFLRGANVSAAEIIDRGTIRLRVWERGVGMTSACGSAACATLVAAAKRGLADRSAIVQMDGGALHITWDNKDDIQMAGPASLTYSGVIDVAALLPPGVQ